MRALIGVDWGSSNLRAFRFDDGAVVDVRHSSRGIVTMDNGDFEGVLAALLDGWTANGLPIVMAGMVGSRNGWREAAYLACPADPRSLAAALTPVETRLGACFIVPGLSTGGADGPVDVMRGEETQLLGAGIADGRVVLPGTHSKWAILAGDRIERFHTALTGELYALLLAHSLLGRLAVAAPVPDDAAFARGVRRSLVDPALSMTLFGARAEVLTGGLAGTAVTDYLSGLLIGAEVAAMAVPGESLTMIGDAGLCGRYRAALSIAGVEDVAIIDGERAIATGLWRIGRECL